jgi:GNAT superfamily N-acetyltransferase
MSKLDLLRLHIVPQIEADDDDPSNYILQHEGDIIAGSDPDEERIIGHISVDIVQRERANLDGQSLWQVMDCLSGDTADCFESLFTLQREELKQSVISRRSAYREDLPNLMLINRLELDADVRGRGIGKQVVDQVVERLGKRCEVIVCCPFPLQFIGKGIVDSPEFKAAWNKVRRFWLGVGFERIPRTNYFIWPD